MTITYTDVIYTASNTSSEHDLKEGWMEDMAEAWTKHDAKILPFKDKLSYCIPDTSIKSGTIFCSVEKSNNLL